MLSQPKLISNRVIEGFPRFSRQGMSEIAEVSIGLWCQLRLETTDNSTVKILQNVIVNEPSFSSYGDPNLTAFP